MTPRIPLHAPHAAPAVLVSQSATGGMGVLGALAAVGCAAAALVLFVGPAPQPVTRMPAAPVAAVSSASPTAADPLPPRPGQPLPTATELPAAAGVPIGAPVPGWRLALDDAASAVPNLEPLPVDPAVEAAMARLRVAATGDAGSRRPGVIALAALDHAFDQVGDPYVWGATGPDTFDCSGLMLWSYGAAGVTLPRVSRDQYAAGGEPVAVDDLLPGDLVFFATASWDPGVVHHVGMYAGSGLMVAAPRPGLTVRVEPMSAQGYVGAVRPVPARGPAKEADTDTERPGHRTKPTTETGAGAAATPPPPSATSSPSSTSSSSSSSSSADPTTAPSPTPSAPESSPAPDPVPSSANPEPDPTATSVPTGVEVNPQPTIVATLSPVLLRIGVLPTVPTRGTR